jgi:PAS domain S-box-containing protein
VPLLTPLIATKPTSVLEKDDFNLIQAIQAAQRSFVITDPSLPDNPIIFASKGFLELSGYQLEDVLGRNCRFLQGPKTDPLQARALREGIERGEDTSVCLLNYRADGTEFYNQIFVAALRDADNRIINYVGVQVEVSLFHFDFNLFLSLDLS